MRCVRALTCSTHAPLMFHPCSTCSTVCLYHAPLLSRLLSGTPTPLNPLPQRTVEHATNYSGTRVEHVWNMCGTRAEHDAGRRSARIDALEAPRGLAIWLWRLSADSCRPSAERLRGWPTFVGDGPGDKMPLCATNEHAMRFNNT